MAWPAFPNAGVAVAAGMSRRTYLPTLVGRSSPAILLQTRQSNATHSLDVGARNRLGKRDGPGNDPAAQSPQTFLASCAALLVNGLYGVSCLGPIYWPPSHHCSIGQRGLCDEYVEPRDV